jgi:hypothetical protein
LVGSYVHRESHNIVVAWEMVAAEELNPNRLLTASQSEYTSVPPVCPEAGVLAVYEVDGSTETCVGVPDPHATIANGTTNASATARKRLPKCISVLPLYD